MKKIYSSVISIRHTNKKFHLELSASNIIKFTPLKGGISGFEAFSIIAKELIPFINKGNYKRICPYKFSEKNINGKKRDIYIEFAEQRINDLYEIKTKELFKISHKNNISAFRVFAYDLLDYLVYNLGICYKVYENHYVIYTIDNNIDYTIDGLITEQQLIRKKFIFPSEERD